jgi:hypothetical protein
LCCIRSVSDSEWDENSCLTARIDGEAHHTKRNDNRAPLRNIIVNIYDALDRLVEVNVTRGPGVVGSDHQAFAYDGLGRRGNLALMFVLVAGAGCFGWFDRGCDSSFVPSGMSQEEFQSPGGGEIRVCETVFEAHGGDAARIQVPSDAEAYPKSWADLRITAAPTHFMNGWDESRGPADGEWIVRVAIGRPATLEDPAIPSSTDGRKLSNLSGADAALDGGAFLGLCGTDGIVGLWDVRKPAPAAGLPDGVGLELPRCT